jgi:hypothetical protein
VSLLVEREAIVSDIRNVAKETDGARCRVRTESLPLFFKDQSGLPGQNTEHRSELTGLAEVVEAWPLLPESIKTAILAITRSQQETQA